MKRSFQLAVLAVAVLVSFPAFGIVCAGTTGNSTVTDSFVPGGGYVGVRGVGSAVYLGDGWALTAAHVGGGTVTLGGLDYTVVAGSAVRLKDPDLGGNTDLVLMKLNPNETTGLLPPLPTLNIASTPVQAGAAIWMIGAGRSCGTVREYQVTQNPDETFTWNGTRSTWTLYTFDPKYPRKPYFDADGNRYAGEYAYGYTTVTSTPRVVRWGTNVVDADIRFLMTGYGWVNGFYTIFDDNGDPNEAQAASGDSGGGVFAADGTLLGIMLAASIFPNQPDNTAIFGNASLVLDLSYYLPQILAIAPELAVPEPATLTMLLATSVFVVLRKRRAVT